MTVGQFMQIYNAQIRGSTSTARTEESQRPLGPQHSAEQDRRRSVPARLPGAAQHSPQHRSPAGAAGNALLAVDFVRRNFEDTLFGSLDQNASTASSTACRRRDPALHDCCAAERSERSVLYRLDYVLDSRRPRGLQRRARQARQTFFAPLPVRRLYAFTDRSAIGTISNLDNYFESYGPGRRASPAELSGLIDFPGNVQLSIISAMSSRGPVMPSITSVDLDGDGTTTTQIPGVSYNCFNRGCDKADLAAAVTAFNTQYAGKRDARGQTIPTLALPTDYEFGDSFSSQDLRVTKTFNFASTQKLAVFVEVFNVFNVANLGGYSFNSITPPRSVCRPTALAKCSAPAARARSRSADGLRSETTSGRTKPGAARPRRDVDRLTAMSHARDMADGSWLMAYG
jgi:hypothetical protein